MNLYEFEGKELLKKYGILVPKGIVLRRGDNIADAYYELGLKNVMVKAQVLTGKRGKNNGIKFCSSIEEVEKAVQNLFSSQIRNQFVTAVLLEERLEILEEYYLSVTYDSTKKEPVLIFSKSGGMDIEEVSEEKIIKKICDVRNKNLPIFLDSNIQEIAQKLWECFLDNDARVVEINPLVKTSDNKFFAVDAKVGLDDDAFYRHEEWKNFEPRSMLGRLPTARENEVRKIDEGENYYRGTAGKYIEMDGTIAVLFSGGGASIANMDALIKTGLKPANYTEYSGNPPREKVYKLAKLVLSKPGLEGLWIAGGVANFTDIAETLGGIVDALEEIKPDYPIVVRRAGPNEEEGKRVMEECAKKNNLNIKIFGKEISMSETAKILAQMVQDKKNL